jgi:lipopolysaccharide/colanic/teichoic acid biosynthesis glycosyltransferase
MKNINELEKEIKRLKIANRTLDIVFSIIGIIFLATLLYILKNA